LRVCVRVFHFHYRKGNRFTYSLLDIHAKPFNLSAAFAYYDTRTGAMNEYPDFRIVAFYLNSWNTCGKQQLL